MKYFTISELCRSNTAESRNIDNTPDAIITSHLTELVNNLLDPLRENWAAFCKKNNLGSGALIVSSGYRCHTLNSIVGGVKNSAHMNGYAADIVPGNHQQSMFEKWVSTVFAKGKVKYDQIIIEKKGSSRWIHFGYKNNLGKQRMQSFKLTVKK